MSKKKQPTLSEKKELQKNSSKNKKKHLKAEESPIENSTNENNLDHSESKTKKSKKNQKKLPEISKKNQKKSLSSQDQDNLSKNQDAIVSNTSSNESITAKPYKEPNKNSLLSPDIFSFGIISLGIFILFANYQPETTGIIGKFIINKVSYLFGNIGIHLLIVFLFIHAIIISIIPRSYLYMTVWSIPTYFMLLIVCIPYLPSSLGNSEIYIGKMGVFISYYTHRYIGKVGTMLLTLSFLAGPLCYAFKIKFQDVLRYLNIVFYIKLLYTLSKIIASHSNQFFNKEFIISKTKKLIQFLFYEKNKKNISQNKSFIPASKTVYHNNTTINDTHNLKNYTPPFCSKKILHNSQNSLKTTPINTDESMSTDEPLSFDTYIKPSSPTFQSPKTTEPQLTTAIKEADSQFQLPPLSLLKKPDENHEEAHIPTEEHFKQASILEKALYSFNVDAKVVSITAGHSITRFELQPGNGVKVNKITALSKDIALKLAAISIRIEAPIPGKSLVGIEVPNHSTHTIQLSSLLANPKIQSNTQDKLLTTLGLTLTGTPILMDLSKMPHILIAGATGSGKSVCINTIIMSILMRSTPKDVKFLMIDPKKVELNLYEGIPHLLAPVVTNPQKAAATLKKWALFEMERRYEYFSKHGVKDIRGYNKFVESQSKKTTTKSLETNLNHTPNDAETSNLKKIPYIVVIIDELADLMMVASHDVEQTICRLAQMARATGIHLVIATQRPSVNVVTGLIKANIPSRISFFLQSQIDSRTILDMSGAEQLLGKGDMLYLPVGSFKPSRAQGVYISEEEVKSVVTWLRSQEQPEYLDEIMTVEPLNQEDNINNDSDELYETAKELVLSTNYASTSFLQRKLRIGYNRAARIMDELRENNICPKKPEN